MSKPVYSVRRARKNLLEAIRAEIRSTIEQSSFSRHSKFVAARERAIRDLIAAARKESPDAP